MAGKGLTGTGFCAFGAGRVGKDVQDVKEVKEVKDEEDVEEEGEERLVTLVRGSGARIGVRRWNCGRGAGGLRQRPGRSSAHFLDQGTARGTPGQLVERLVEVQLAEYWERSTLLVLSCFVIFALRQTAKASYERQSVWSLFLSDSGREPPGIPKLLS